MPKHIVWLIECISIVWLIEIYCVFLHGTKTVYVNMLPIFNPVRSWWKKDCVMLTFSELPTCTDYIEILNLLGTSRMHLKVLPVCIIYPHFNQSSNLKRYDCTFRKEFGIRPPQSAPFFFLLNRSQSFLINIRWNLIDQAKKLIWIYKFRLHI